MNNVRKTLCSIAVALALLGVGTVIASDKERTATPTRNTCSEAACSGTDVFSGSSYDGVCVDSGCYGCSCRGDGGELSNTPCS